MNNENIFSHTSSEQTSLLRKRIESEMQKSTSHDDRIKQLKQRIEQVRKRTQEKRQKLGDVQLRVKEEKERSEEFRNVNSSSEHSSSSDHSSNLPTANLINHNDSSSNIISQLREHFKALRQQMLTQSFQSSEQYQDQVDVDNMTYQELLQLGDKIGKVSKGLDAKKLKSLQVKKYHKGDNQSEEAEQVECAICREEVEEGSDCIELGCKHLFHEDCIKGWLNVEKHCPNCKREITEREK